MKDRTRQAIARAHAVIEGVRGGDTALVTAFGYAEAIVDLADENDQLRAKLIFLERYLHGVARRPELGFGAQDLRDEANEIGKLLGAGESA